MQFVEPPRRVIKPTTCWSVNEYEEWEYVGKCADSSNCSCKFVGLGQDSNVAYLGSRNFKTNKRVLIVSVILTGFFFLQIFIAHDHHTRPFVQEEYDNTLFWLRYIIPTWTCFVSIWTIVGIGTTVKYMKNDQYGFLPNSSFSFWHGIEVI